MSALTRQDVLSEQEFLKAPPSPLLYPRTQTMYRDRRRLASNSRYSRTIPRSLRKIEVNPDKSAAIQFKYGKIRSRLIVDKNTPNLKLPMRSFARRLTINRRIPPTLSVGHETYLPIHLTLLQRQLKALMTSTTRMTDLE
ncbi:hypothetical protein EVAR_33729_1 [Eumeta japonica]|uniref:Uncharacterized protein n=1 Tax=Eumeta variegata TaxID=151549 RepID=A0A4C1VRL5_EUMVA|nr:hypothetical protein EVAR_33729_1 [Eumeta japonica]